MNKDDNIFQAACPKEVTAFNSDKQFGDYANIITPEQFSAACDRIDDLIAHSKAMLHNKD
jgi:hypothetical protein